MHIVKTFFAVAIAAILLAAPVLAAGDTLASFANNARKLTDSRKAAASITRHKSAKGFATGVSRESSSFAVGKALVDVETALDSGDLSRVQFAVGNLLDMLPGLGADADVVATASQLYREASSAARPSELKGFPAVKAQVEAMVSVEGVAYFYRLGTWAELSILALRSSDGTATPEQLINPALLTDFIDGYPQASQKEEVLAKLKSMRLSFERQTGLLVRLNYLEELEGLSRLV